MDYNNLSAFGEVREYESMAGHVTLGVGGAARCYFRPHDLDALVASMTKIPSEIPLLVIGRGSNLLVTDAGFDGVVIDLASLQGISLDGTLLHCQAGCRMSQVAARCADAGLAGAEFMATVPGNIGGGVAMNAGAFGHQFSDILQRVALLHRDGRREAVAADALKMAYRHSVLPTGALVVGAEFELQRDDAEAIRGRIRAMRTKRGVSQPLAQPNCGSVFKNPPGDHAARLIEAAGLKGERCGQAQISPQHANFIVNLGGASSQDVLHLMTVAQRAVKLQSDIHLEPELKVVGSWCEQ
ncbi:MAG: UDP-N-acetylmuramate dehydrogenase [Mariprofundales bacterium]|nr:UDP-N-acetylmuramate dehydrogenase [Mariprofundales bacterium]